MSGHTANLHDRQADLQPGLLPPLHLQWGLPYSFKFFRSREPDQPAQESSAAEEQETTTEDQSVCAVRKSIMRATKSVPR
jgi:hypothetical protein